MTTADISPKMLEVIAHMKRHGGKLHRYAGGYWADADWYPYHGPCFGTSTIEAIVRRGYAAYTVWVDGRSGNKFPIEAMLTDKGEQP
jgi:hypothetical protein